MAYTTIDKPSDYFETLTWTGADTSAGRDFTGVGFQPDWVWCKTRSVGNGHKLFDSVRGVGKSLQSEGTGAEVTNDGNGYIDSFDSDGFSSIAGSSNNYNFNISSETIVAWNWKAGTSFTNDASATGIGNIDSTGSVNTDAGFSVISYTGDANADNTVAHGLGSVPKMIILKNRSISSNWMVYHASTGAQAPLFLNLNNAAGSGDPDRFKVVPTSSVFTPGTAQEGNGSGNSIIAYCFADVKGYSKVGGSYTGNGQDTPNGVFTYLGFTPAFILIKATDINSWVIVDNKRPADSNPVDNSLAADSNAAETTGDINTTFDFLSNGFRTNGNSGNNNSSGQKYIYMAFAENPFVTSTGVPATAR